MRCGRPTARTGDASTGGGPRAPPRSSPGRIWLVEDDLDARLLVDAALHEAGFEGKLEVQADGSSALDRATEAAGLTGFDLVVLDVQLPGVDGLEVLEAIRAREDRTRLPVVVLTNVDDDAVARRAYEAGANCWIRKPAHFEDLERALDGVLALMRPGQRAT